MSGKFLFGENVLGPVFYAFCAKLHLFQAGYEDHGVALYATRGGARLKFLYETFLKNQGLQNIIPQELFYISRFSSAVGCLSNDFEYVASLLQNQFWAKSNQEAIHLLLGENVPHAIPNGEQPFTLENFKKIYYDSGEISSLLQKNCQEQYSCLFDYLNSLVKEQKKIVLVDTGWTGNTQAVLMRSFPQWEWNGAYFGKWDYRQISPWHFYSVTGLMVEKGLNDFIFQFHHIVEDPMEPNWDSVVQYYRKNGAIENNATTEKSADTVTEKDEQFAGIKSYFLKTKMMPFDEIEKRSSLALSALKRGLLMPTKKDVDCILTRSRSADYGEDISTSVFSNKGSFIEKYKAALWKQGFLVHEYGRMGRIINTVYNLFDHSKLC